MWRVGLVVRDNLYQIQAYIPFSDYDPWNYAVSLLIQDLTRPYRLFKVYTVPKFEPRTCIGITNDYELAKSNILLGMETIETKYRHRIWI